MQHKPVEAANFDILKYVPSSFDQIYHTKLFWFATVSLLIYAYLKFVVFTYWKRNGIPHRKPVVPFGNALPLVLGQMSTGNQIKSLYDKHKEHPFFGIYMFHQPILMINDPELIRHVLIKDFARFRDRGMYHNESVDPMSANLFLLPGEDWRLLRNKLSPTFTSGKLKYMYPLVQEIGEELIKASDRLLAESNVIELKDFIGRYTTDSISSIAFGFNCNSLENPNHDMKRHGTMVFDLNPMKYALAAFAPVLLDLLRMPLIPRKVINYFSKTFQEMIQYRRENNISRKDFLNLLMQLMDNGSLEDDENSQNDSKSEGSDGKMSLTHAQAQAFVFFIAGFETTSSTITYCLYELALNPEIQDKVQAEIDEYMAKPEGITYEVIVNKLEYLQMVFSETLRKHPSVPFLNRVCIENCDIPRYNLHIEKGTKVIISVSGIHRDPNIYPDPERFDPERFSKENVAARHPTAYLPFGDGPRYCIGMRFGVLQSKVALVQLLANYRFSVCKQTPIPIIYTKRSITQTPEGGVYLEVQKRTKYCTKL